MNSLETHFHPVRATMFGAMALFVIASASCGGEDSGLATEARSLKTGEMHLFESPNAVPDGWYVCANQTCYVPLTVPCCELGANVCGERSDCTLENAVPTAAGDDTPDQTNRVPGNGDTVPDGANPSAEASSPNSPNAMGDDVPGDSNTVGRSAVGNNVPGDPNAVGPNAMGDNVPGDSNTVGSKNCVSLDPTSCEDLTDEQTCNSRSACMWAFGPGHCVSLLGPGTADANTAGTETASDNRLE
jgi:hypothetical protein